MLVIFTGVGGQLGYEVINELKNIIIDCNILSSCNNIVNKMVLKKELSFSGCLK